MALSAGPGRRLVMIRARPPSSRRSSTNTTLTAVDHHQQQQPGRRRADYLLASSPSSSWPDNIAPGGHSPHRSWMKPLLLPKARLRFFLRLASSSSSSAKVTAFANQEEEEKVFPPPSDADLVGPPDPQSNLRLWRLHAPPDESRLHRRYRLLRQDTHQWSHEFWRRHNLEFAAAKKEFVNKKGSAAGKDEALSADEMSVFYKEFLDSQWSNHVRFNVEWQRRNFAILGLSVMVAVERLFRRGRN